MLAEVAGIEQEDNKLKRRWFSDEDLDLYVWYDDRDEIARFQLCFDKGHNEKALTWGRDSGLSLQGVDDGESGVFRMKSTPVLTGEQRSDLADTRRVFIDAAQKLEHDLYEFILNHLPDS